MKMKLDCDSTLLREKTATRPHRSFHGLQNLLCRRKSEKLGIKAPAGSSAPGGGREGGSGSESGCVDLVLSHGLSSPRQGDVCSPRCDSSIMGSPMLPTMSCAELSTAVRDAHHISCRTIGSKAQKRESTLSTPQLLVTRNQNALSLLLPVTGGRR